MTDMLLVFLDDNFNPVAKEQATLAKVFSPDGEGNSYFLDVDEDFEVPEDVVVLNRRKKAGG